jgi:hypothetical protein
MLIMLLLPTASLGGCDEIRPTGSLAVVNNILWGQTEYDMVALYVAPSGQAFDLYEALDDEPLAYGDEILFAFVQSGEYDIIALDADGLYYAFYNVGVYSSSITTVSMTQQHFDEALTTEAGNIPVTAETGDLLVTHAIDWTDGLPTPKIMELYMSEASNEVWDIEYLLGTELAFGESFALPATEEGIYDILLRDDGGNSYLQMGTEIISGYTTEVVFTTENFTELAEFR